MLFWSRGYFLRRIYQTTSQILQRDECKTTTTTCQQAAQMNQTWRLGRRFLQVKNDGSVQERSRWEGFHFRSIHIYLGANSFRKSQNVVLHILGEPVLPLYNHLWSQLQRYFYEHSAPLLRSIFCFLATSPKPFLQQQIFWTCLQYNLSDDYIFCKYFSSL